MKRIQIILFIGLIFGMIGCDFGYPCLNVYTSHNVFASLLDLDGNIVKKGEKIKYDSLKISILIADSVIAGSPSCFEAIRTGRLKNLAIITHITDSLGNIINKDTITSIFRCAFIFHGQPEETKPEDIEKVIRKRVEIPSYIILYFKQPPTDTATWQRFEVIYEEIDGRIYRDTTQKVFVLP